MDMDLPIHVIALNGGKIVGKTRLQKTVFLIQKLLNREVFEFDYHYFGPFSEELAEFVDFAEARGRLAEEEKIGFYRMPYTVYSTDESAPKKVFNVDAAKVKAWLDKLESIDAISLELAATRVYLAIDAGEDESNLDARLKQLKPQKATEARLLQSRKLLEQLGL